MAACYVEAGNALAFMHMKIHTTLALRHFRTAFMQTLILHQSDSEGNTWHLKFQLCLLSIHKSEARASKVCLKVKATNHVHCLTSELTS